MWVILQFKQRYKSKTYYGRTCRDDLKHLTLFFVAKVKFFLKRCWKQGVTYRSSEIRGYPLFCAKRYFIHFVKVPFNEYGTNCNASDGFLTKIDFLLK